MKMQMRKILVLPAIDDQPVARELEFAHDRLYGSNQIGKKCGSGVEFHQTGDRLFGHEQNVERIGWLRVVKRQQGFGLPQALYRNGKAHVCENPSDQLAAWPATRQIQEEIEHRVSVTKCDLIVFHGADTGQRLDRHGQ
jgi:hypothetical protein